MSTTPITKSIHLAAKVEGLSRTETFLGRSYLVVPVVALVGNNVVYPQSGNGGGEFVPAEVLSIAPYSWDYRPLVPDHPSGVSACDIPVLESQYFGHIFNARYADSSLKVEAWIDIERATLLGGNPKSVLDRCAEGAHVEVSIGATTIAAEEDGTYNDLPYAYRWVWLIPDHLAMLPEGVIGACNADMGCGASRLQAKIAETSIMEVQMEPEKDTTTAAESTPVAPSDRPMSFGSRMMQAIRNALSPGPVDPSPASLVEGVSNEMLQGLIATALRDTIAGFYQIYCVFPDGDGADLGPNSVVYEVYTSTDHYALYASTYKFEPATRNVTINSDQREVLWTSSFKIISETLAAKETPVAPVAAAHECNCHKEKTTMATPTTTPNAPAPEKAALIQKLTSGKVFKPEDAAALETFSVERLSALAAQEESIAAAVSTPEAKPEAPAPVVAVAAPATLTADQVLAALPAEMRQVLQSLSGAATSHRTSLISALSSAQKVYTVEQLNAKPDDELFRLAQLAGLDVAEKPSYLGAAGTLATTEDATVYAPTKGYTAALSKAKPQDQAN